MIDGIAATNAFTQAQENILGGAYNLDNNAPIEKPTALKISDDSLIIEDNMDENTLIDLSVNALNKTSDLSVLDEIMKSVTEMDSNFKNGMGRMVDWPDFNKYLEGKGETLHNTLDNNNLGITHISNIDEAQPETKEIITLEKTLQDSKEQMQAGQKRQMAFNSAAIEYSQDTTRWSISMHLMGSKIRLLTAAVSQLNTGLKTLFTSQ